jgi:hypothetical protein
MTKHHLGDLYVQKQPFTQTIEFENAILEVNGVATGFAGKGKLVVEQTFDQIYDDHLHENVGEPRLSLIETRVILTDYKGTFYPHRLLGRDV